MTRDFGKEPVVLQLRYNEELDSQIVPPSLFLRSKRVSWSDLGSALQEELKARPDRVVYFEADPEVAYNDAVKAIDIIRGAHVDVVMLIPDKNRNEAATRSTQRRER